MSPGGGVRLLYLVITLSIILGDQLSKALVTSRMTLSSTTPVVPGFVHLTLVHNRGALFGMFRDLSDPYRGFIFTAVPLVAIVLIVIFQYRTAVADAVTQSGLALILGGAIGNLVDRLRLGYVIDFLDFFVGEYHWPAFNVADSSICVGVSLLFIDLLRRERGRREAPIPPQA